MSRSGRRQERDWPTLPIPFFSFRHIYDRIARDEWDDPAVGKLPPFTIENKGLILSALGHPFASAGGKEVYPSIPAKAAALFRGLVKNHGLGDGNKRLAVTIMSAFLLTNGWLPRYSNSQLYRYALRVARRKGAYPVPAIERWIRRNAVLAPKKDLDVIRKQNVRIRATVGDILDLALLPDLLPPKWFEVAEGIDNAT